jgi:membrane-associated phospholipid phosphatase
VDDALFLGRNPNVLFDRLKFPLLTEYLQIVYASYYFIPLVLLTGLLLRRELTSAVRAMTVIVVCFFLSYLGYFLIPATSPAMNVEGLYPWPPQEEELRTGETDLPGILLAGPIRAALYRAEAIRHDCFPSGHVAVSLAVLLLARRLHRGMFRILLVPVVSLIVSTVYLRYHYVIDAVAGVALAYLSLALGTWLDGAGDRPPGRSTAPA